MLLSPGRLLDPAALIAAAGADCAEVDVAIRPRLALLSTGDGLVQPGTARDSALGVPDSVSVGVSALVDRWGASLTGCTRLGDDLTVMKAAGHEMSRAADVIVVTGGASVGERDLAKAMFEPLG